MLFERVTLYNVDHSAFYLMYGRLSQFLVLSIICYKDVEHEGFFASSYPGCWGFNPGP